ncbi:MAG: hypothetical protein AAF415_11920 [Pseudomonadota bacterium]
MKTKLLVLGTFALLAACDQTIAGRCNATHGSGTVEASQCIQLAEREILTGPGSAFAKSQRGGGG